MVDVSQTNAAAQIDAVASVLDELDVEHLPVITVWNKVKMTSSGRTRFWRGLRLFPEVNVSTRFPTSTASFDNVTAHAG